MREILLLQLGRLGDLVQTLPLVRRIKEEHPGCRVTLVCLEVFRGILEESGGWDRLVPINLDDTDSLADPEKAAAFPDLPPFSAIPEFRETYDAVVTLNPDLGSAVLCGKIKAAVKYGRIHTYSGELRLLGAWSKYLFAMVAHRHENLFNLVDIHMGMTGLAPRPQPPCLPVSQARLDQARELLLEAGWKGTHPLVALQTGSSDLHRAWDAAHFAALAARLCEDGAEIVLLGDPRETARAEEVILRSGKTLINLAGKTPLPILPAVVKACDLLVSNDTGTIHVAAAVGTPTMGLYFSTAYYSETAPYGDGHAVLQVEIPCAPCNTSTRCPVQLCREHLKVEDVHRTALWLLRPAGPPPVLPPTLGFYRSRFLTNGALLYAPVLERELSGQYLSGLLSRLAWEKALGLPKDPVLEALWRQAARQTQWGEKRRAMESVLDGLADPLRRGLEAAGRLRRAFAEGQSEFIRPFHEQLARLGDTLSGIGSRSGLFGAYLRFEMMDLDYTEYPALAANLEAKYQALNAWMDAVRESLQNP